ncbi:MAG: hypothetical protein OEV30_07625 [Ignavibacteria bacterium]|nr:hypothetical protein [Ignavibacteria bacterium]
MPIPCQIDPQYSVLHAKCVGVVTLEEILRHIADLAENNSGFNKLDLLLDISDLETIPDTTEIASIVNRIEDLRSEFSFGACAIVAGSDALFGIARMFTVLAEQQFRLARVFRDFLQAEFWLHSVNPGRPSPN